MSLVITSCRLFFPEARYRVTLCRYRSTKWIIASSGDRLAVESHSLHIQSALSPLHVEVTHHSPLPSRNYWPRASAPPSASTLESSPADCGC